MKKNVIFLFVLAFSILLFSCKKDKDSAQPTYPHYADFAAGSYWVYQQFIVDSLGNATATNNLDSCFVEKDTIIDGQTYYKYFRPVPYSYSQTGYGYMRDSLNYIVAPGGFIMFASQDFKTVFYSHYNVLDNANHDTLYYAYTKMEDKDLAITVPAGTFVTSDYRTTYNMYPIWSMAGAKRSVHKRYAENMGVVTETLPFFASDPKYTERRLIRYHVIPIAK
jgi:hypothetical protein